MITQSVRTGVARNRHTDTAPARLTLDPFTTVRADALRAAAARVSDRWSSDAAEIVSAQDVTFELLELVRTIEAPESSVLGNDTDSATLVLRSRLLQELRQEILSDWESRGAPASVDTLNVLAGLERAHSLLAPPSNDGLARRLSDAGGLDLVVEVAHDLRSPLTSILFLAETMLRGHSGELNELQRHQLGIVYGAALQLISTASDMVELARGGEQMDRSDAAPFSLKGVIDPVTDLVGPMAHEKGIELRVTCTAEDRRIGLPVPLSRVLLNLTTNALKFAEDRFIEINVTAVGDTRVEFSVRDSGSGIDADELNALFHPFRRRGSAGCGYYFSGVSLGLNICRKLVRSMGSELRVETAPAWGSRFFFELDLPCVVRI